MKAHVGVERDAHRRLRGASDGGLQRALALGPDVAGRAAVEPPDLGDGCGERVLAGDQLVRAVQPARAEEGAVAAIVEGDEPQAGARPGRETKARVDAFVAQLAGEQVPELVVADHTAERGRDAEAREAHGHVRRSAPGVDVEALAVAQLSPAVGEQVHQRLAEAEDVRSGHAPSISNRPISGT